MNKIIILILVFLSLGADAKLLSKSDIIELVNKNFPEILIQREKIIQALGKTRASRGSFDPSIEGKLNSVPISGYENNYYDLSLNYPIENTGNTIKAGYRIGRGEWPVYYQNYLTNSYGDTYIGLNMPLLRNKLIDKNRQIILTNELLTEGEKYLLLIKKNEIIVLAVDAYYEWLRASYRIKIATLLLNIAKVRQNAIDKQVSLNDIAKINQIENKRLILKRRSVLVSERQKYTNSINKLNFYIKPGFNLTNTSKKFKMQAPIISKINSNKIHLKKINKFQPYLNYLETKINRSKLAINQSRNEMQPKLDLELYINKQHGKGNLKLEQTSINLGLNYKIPLKLRKAQGQVANQKSQIRSYNLQKQLFIRRLNLTYKNIVNDLKSFKTLHRFRSQEVFYAEKLKDAERLKFKAGDSSLFLVNQREQTVAETQFLVIDSLINYYQRANLLESICFYRRKCLFS